MRGVDSYPWGLDKTLAIFFKRVNYNLTYREHQTRRACVWAEVQTTSLRLFDEKSCGTERRWGRRLNEITIRTHLVEKHGQQRRTTNEEKRQQTKKSSSEFTGKTVLAVSQASSADRVRSLLLGETRFE